MNTHINVDLENTATKYSTISTPFISISQVQFLPPAITQNQSLLCKILLNASHNLQINFSNPRDSTF